MRPGAVIALGTFKETHDFTEAFYALFASDEVAIDSDNQRRNSESARTGGNDTVVSWNVFACHSGVRISSIPVIAKAGLLQHGEKFIVAEFARRGASRGGKRRLSILPVRGSHFVLGRHAWLCQKICVTVCIWKLNADG